MRFLFYASVGMLYLETLLWQRASYVWKNSHLPSVSKPTSPPFQVANIAQYMGPTISQLIHLFVLLVVNGFTAFALSILLLRSLWTIGSNTTTIETWEIERHATLVRRARVLGGYLEGPGGIRVYIKKQEYPYDIGIWANIKQAMGGSANVSQGIQCFSHLARQAIDGYPGDRLVLATCCKPRSSHRLGV